MSSTTQKSIDIKKSLVEAILAGLIALIVFGPIVGVVLEGYSFNLEPTRVAWIIGVVMIGRFALSLFLQTPKGLKILDGFESTGSGVHVLPADHKSRLRWIIPLLIVLAVIVPFVSNSYLLGVVILGLIYVLLGLGLNIVVGLAGLLDLGYVAFYAIGAYGLALGYQYLGLGFWTVLPLAAITAGLAGCILGFPVLRLHGDYLAIVTLGFGEIIRLILNNWLSLTGGPNGMPAPLPTFFGLEFGKRAKDGGVPFHEFFGIAYNPDVKYYFIYAVLFLVVLAVLYIKHRLVKMPVGRAWEALREDEIACRSMGLNHVLVKLSAFTIGASTAGLAEILPQPHVLQDVRRYAPGEPCRPGADIPEHSPVQGNVGAGKSAGGPAHVGQPQHARRHPQHQGLPQGRKRRAGCRVLLAGSGRSGRLRQPSRR
jgi:branched-chain amino acid transport system permease protein